MCDWIFKNYFVLYDVNFFVILATTIIIVRGYVLQRFHCKTMTDLRNYFAVSKSFFVARWPYTFDPPPPLYTVCKIFYFIIFLFSLSGLLSFSRNPRSCRRGKWSANNRIVQSESIYSRFIHGSEFNIFFSCHEKIENSIYCTGKKNLESIVEQNNNIYIFI